MYALTSRGQTGASQKWSQAEPHLEQTFRRMSPLPLNLWRLGPGSEPHCHTVQRRGGANPNQPGRSFCREIGTWTLRGSLGMWPCIKYRFARRSPNEQIRISVPQQYCMKSQILRSFMTWENRFALLHINIEPKGAEPSLWASGKLQYPLPQMFDHWGIDLDPRGLQRGSAHGCARRGSPTPQTTPPLCCGASWTAMFCLYAEPFGAGLQLFGWF